MQPFWLKAHLPELALANVKNCTHIFLKLLQTQTWAVPEGWRCRQARCRSCALTATGAHQENNLTAKAQGHNNTRGSRLGLQGNPVVSVIPMALSGLFLMRHHSSPSAYLSPERESFARTRVSPHPDFPLAEARLCLQQEVGREQCTKSWSLQGHDRMINQAVVHKERNHKPATKPNKVQVISLGGSDANVGHGDFMVLLAGCTRGQSEPICTDSLCPSHAGGAGHTQWLLTLSDGTKPEMHFLCMFSFFAVFVEAFTGWI